MKATQLHRLLFQNQILASLLKRGQEFPAVLCFLTTKICNFLLWNVALNLEVTASSFCRFGVRYILLFICYRNFYLLDYVCCGKSSLLIDIVIYSDFFLELLHYIRVINFKLLIIGIAFLSIDIFWGRQKLMHNFKRFILNQEVCFFHNDKGPNLGHRW